MHNRPRGTGSRYLNLTLILGAINLFWSLLLIYASFGMFAALILALALNYAITRLARHRTLSRFQAETDLNLTFYK